MSGSYDMARPTSCIAVQPRPSRPQALHHLVTAAALSWRGPRGSKKKIAQSNLPRVLTVKLPSLSDHPPPCSMQVQPIVTTRISTGIAWQAEQRTMRSFVTVFCEGDGDHEVFCAASFTQARLGWTILGALGSQGARQPHLGGTRTPQRRQRERRRQVGVKTNDGMRKRLSNPGSKSAFNTITRGIG